MPWWNCHRCNCPIHDSYRYYEKDNNYYCVECSFIEGIIDDTTFLNGIGIGITDAHAYAENGQIFVWIGKNKIPPHKRTDKQQRKTSEYKSWRTKVFERDNYTCQHCNQRGGELNAHHIKPFKKFPKLRYELSNGITLCYKCHKLEHKKR